MPINSFEALKYKIAIEQQYGQIGGFVFNHIVSTTKLIQESRISQQPALTNLDSLPPEAQMLVNELIADEIQKGEQRAREIINQSHMRFLQTVNREAITVKYSFRTPTGAQESRELTLGNPDHPLPIVLDFSAWLTIDFELY